MSVVKIPRDIAVLISACKNTPAWMPIILFISLFYLPVTAIARESDYLPQQSLNKVDIKVVTENYPPYQYVDNNGVIQGCAVDLVKALFKQSGDDLKINLIPWARAYYLVKNFKNTLIFSMARNRLREHNFHWIGKIRQEKYLFWGLKSKYPQKILSESEFSKSIVAVAKDTTNDQMLTAMGYKNLHRITENTQAIKMLLNQRVNLMVETEIGMRKRFEKRGYDFSKVKPVYKIPKLDYDLYIAMSSQTDKQIVQSFREAYSNLVQSGMYADITSRCDR